MPVTAYPASSPVTVPDLRAHLRIDGNTEDDVLAAYLLAATEYIQNATGQQMLTATATMTLDDFPGDVLTIARVPLIEVTSIQYIDPAGVTQTVPSTAYRADAASRPGRLVLRPGSSWPATEGTPGCVTITFTCGHGTDPASVPALLRHGVKFMAGHLFENREGTTTVAVSELPLAVQSIVNQHAFPNLIG